MRVKRLRRSRPRPVGRVHACPVLTDAARRATADDAGSSSAYLAAVDAHLSALIAVTSAGE